jgi:GST-like protein
MRDHPIFTRCPAQYPDRLQLFSTPTPNGVKVGIMLEETSLIYEPHRIDIMADESYDPAFLALNPNGKIPAIYDPDGPSGRPLALRESGAILLYLADKTGQFISADRNTRYETIQWVIWQMGGSGQCSAKSALQQIPWQGLRGQAPARPLRSRISAAARCPRRTARGPGVGDGR